MTLQCLVVDDESLSRKLLEENIRQLPFLEVAGVCKNPFEAMAVLQEKKVDLMFLDIQMPGMTGMTFLQGLVVKPMVILVTAYSEYALESYALDVLDYLLKPVSMERFTHAAYKALEEKKKRNALIKQADTLPGADANEAAFFVKADYALVKVNIAEITHIESMKDYIKIYVETSKRPIITKSTLKGIEEKLPEKKFLKVHKSFIVQLSKIASIRNQTIVIGDHEIPLSDAHATALMQALPYQK